MKILKAKCVIDGNGGEPFYDHSVLVQDGQVEAILPWPEACGKGELIDLGEATLLPGLIDAHAHLMLDPASPTGPFNASQPAAEVMLRAVANAQSALRAGVTTLGDMGAANEIIFPLRDAIQSGHLVGPRIIASGVPILPSGGHGSDFVSRVADNVAEIRKAVREQAEAGANLIKVMATSGGGEEPGKSHYTRSHLTIMRQEAGRFGLQVAAHAHGTQGIRDCIAAGIQRIEHCTFFNGAQGFIYDHQAAAEIAARGILVCPTNSIDYRRIQNGGKGAPRRELNEIWRNLLQLGVTFAAGSDAGVTDMHFEDYALIPELMVAELGMSPLQAISSCTINAARSLGQDSEIGSLQPGKTADLIAVAGDPLADMSSLRTVCLIMRSGKILHQSHLK